MDHGLSSPPLGLRLHVSNIHSTHSRQGENHSKDQERVKPLGISHNNLDKIEPILPTLIPAPSN